jgi:hypothetical protein
MSCQMRGAVLLPLLVLRSWVISTRIVVGEINSESNSRSLHLPGAQQSLCEVLLAVL